MQVLGIRPIPAETHIAVGDEFGLSSDIQIWSGGDIQIWATQVATLFPTRRRVGLSR